MISLVKEFIVETFKEIFREKVKKIKTAIAVLYAAVILNLIISTVTLITIAIK